MDVAAPLLVRLGADLNTLRPTVLELLSEGHGQETIAESGEPGRRESSRPRTEVARLSSLLAQHADAEAGEHDAD